MPITRSKLYWLASTSTFRLPEPTSTNTLSGYATACCHRLRMALPPGELEFGIALNPADPVRRSAKSSRDLIRGKTTLGACEDNALDGAQNPRIIRLLCRPFDLTQLRDSAYETRATTESPRDLVVADTLAAKMPDASFEWAQVTAHTATISVWAGIARLPALPIIATITPRRVR